jgi:hypothetical protein
MEREKLVDFLLEAMSSEESCLLLMLMIYRFAKLGHPIHTGANR